MKFLLTSAGISNPSIATALVDLLGKPTVECNALIVPTAIYPFPVGPEMSWKAIAGKGPTVLSSWDGNRWASWS